MTPQLSNCGYIGLGIMGYPMANNLMTAGYPMTLWNRTPAKAQPLVDQGAALADSPADLARRVGPKGVVFINVTDTPDVEAVLFFGDNGVANGASAGLIVVDHSTISPAATQDFSKRLGDQGVTLIDAPVSGGDIGAQQGTLSIMAGGPGEAIERIRPMLDIVGKSTVHVGDSGMGQACKACNQIAVVNALQGVVESLALAKKLGLDLGKMIEVVSGGAGGSWQLANLGPRIAQGDHAPGFMIDLLLKDLGIVLNAAKTNGLPLTGTDTLATQFRNVAEAGGGRLGTQALTKVLEGLGGFTYAE